MLQTQDERRLGLAAKLAAEIPDGRDASRVIHPLADILRARIFAIACGYEDADGLDSVRFDPAFKLACGRLPDSGRDLCSQPTISLRENAPDLRSVILLGRVLLDLWLDSYPVPPADVTLDIHDTCLRRRPRSSAAVAVQRPLRRALPTTDPRLRGGDGSSRCGDPAPGQDAVGQGDPRPSAPARPPHPPPLDWCDANGIDYLFGLPGNRALDRLVGEAADDIRTRRALEKKLSLRGFVDVRYRAKSWKRERRACARIEATCLGLDIRFVVTSLATGTAEHVYEVLYCARGQAENLIKLHKSQLASDRTSFRPPLANQVRLLLHTAAYWLMLGLRDAIPKAHALAVAEFATLRLKLLIPGLFDPGTAPASSRPRRASASPSPQPVPRRRCSDTSPPPSPDPERRGRNRPAKPIPKTPAPQSNPAQPSREKPASPSSSHQPARLKNPSPGRRRE